MRKQFLPGLGDDPEVRVFDFTVPTKKLYGKVRRRRVFRLWRLKIPIGRWHTIDYGPNPNTEREPNDGLR